jgi:hypothetical protein
MIQQDGASWDPAPFGKMLGIAERQLLPSSPAEESKNPSEFEYPKYCVMQLLAAAASAEADGRCEKSLGQATACEQVIRPKLCPPPSARADPAITPTIINTIKTKRMKETP